MWYAILNLCGFFCGIRVKYLKQLCIFSKIPKIINLLIWKFLKNQHFDNIVFLLKNGVLTVQIQAVICLKMWHWDICKYTNAFKKAKITRRWTRTQKGSGRYRSLHPFAPVSLALSFLLFQTGYRRIWNQEKILKSFDWKSCWFSHRKAVKYEFPWITVLWKKDSVKSCGCEFPKPVKKRWNRDL